MTKPILNQDPDAYLQALFQKNNRYYFGDELRDKLVKNLKKTNPSARKIIERFVQKGFVQSSNPVSFGKGMFVYYSQFKTVSFDDLIGLARGRRPPIFRLLSAIKKSGGVLSYYEALKITSSQLKPSNSKNPALDDIILEINHFNLVSIHKDKNNVKYLVANYVDQPTIESLLANHFAAMVTDSIFIYDILTSLENLNLIDNENVIYRSRKTPSLGATHNNFVWDAFAYTQTTGINTTYGGKHLKNAKHALVVIDVVLSRSYEIFDLDGFFGRVQVLLNHTRKERKIIPVLVYKEISGEALNRARSLGILTYNMAAFFGTGIYDVINNTATIKISEQTGQSHHIDPVLVISDTLDLIDQTGNKFNLQNLIGDFFQSLMYQLFRQLYPLCNIDQSGKLLAMDDLGEEGRYYEYDLVIWSNNTKEIIVVELKGSMKNYNLPLGDYQTKNTLKWFFARTLLSFKKHHATGYYKQYKIKAAFINSGKFDNEGKAYLTKLNAGSLKPNQIDIAYDGKKLIRLVEQTDMSLLKETLERYYIKDSKVS
ncbi:hypothetical protein ABID99_004938 [Mucilaginibacter sp. OAE612]|uniref:hypothetical protein n=1 Tax=Mucilaginibacter sp. OAE612 TaxID=3156444 RepID=UPI00359E9141